MANNEESRRKRGHLLQAVLAALVVLLLALFVPPFISVKHYERQITRVVSRSLGRPVSLSSVQVRLLPWPGFVIYDLSVAEDPAYGAEPVLHASKVTASIRLLALWSGRIEIGKISVDEASLNLVRAAAGHWNLDPLFRTAAAQTGPGSNGPVSLPSLEATNSRIDFKNGAEKLPFSLVNADLSVGQDSPGVWSIRLRGQPARTDVSIYQEDTGVVRMEATVRRAPALRLMPVHLDLDWRQAQLGQLARLVTGSDSGWRGDLTGELHLDGTADAAQIAVRLRASGVHRAEFVPTSPLDFDANCNLVYHYAQRSFENLACNSPLGDGRVHLAGEKRGTDAPLRFTMELDHVPVAAGLDALRTVRNGLQPDLEAAGTVSGKLVYAENNSASPAELKLAKPAANHAARGQSEPQGPLAGSLTVENLSLSGGGLTRPIQAPKLALQAAESGASALHQSGTADEANATTPGEALAGTVSIPAGGAVPLTFAMRFSLSGYRVAIHGQAGFARAREMAHAAGIPETAALESLAGDPIAVDLIAEGPWLESEGIPMVAANSPVALPSVIPDAAAASASAMGASTGAPTADSLTGTVTIRNANWKADYLANHLEIAEATLHLEDGNLRWDPAAFSYGPVEGTASLVLPPRCDPSQVEVVCPEKTPPTFSIKFGELDAASFETALLGAHQRGTLLSTLIDRLHPSTAPPWPELQGSVTADSLVLGPVTLEKVSVELHILPDGAEITSLEAVLLGGQVHLTGAMHKPATDQEKPSYSLNGDFENLNARDVGELLGLRWTGSALNGNGKVELTGYTDSDLAASAKGTLHLETRSGSITAAAKTESEAAPEEEIAPPALAHFDRWTVDATIADSAITLGQNQVVSGGRKKSVTAVVTFGDPLELTFTVPKPSVAKR